MAEPLNKQLILTVDDHTLQLGYLRRDLEEIKHAIARLDRTLYSDNGHIGITEVVRQQTEWRREFLVEHKRKQDRLWTVICAVAGTLIVAILSWVTLQMTTPRLNVDEVRRLIYQWQMEQQRRPPDARQEW